MKKILVSIFLGIAVPAILAAQTTPGSTRLILGTLSDPTSSRLRIPNGEEIRIFAPPDWNQPIQWTKGGQPIPGATSNPLILRSVTSAESGRYSMQSSLSGPNAPSSIWLEIHPQGNMANFSSRTTLAPGASTHISGFVVTGSVPKKLLIRAVGPSLAVFNVPNPVRSPRLRIFNSAGQEIPQFFIFLPKSYWDALFQQAGAFPLSGNENSASAFVAGTFGPGGYTFHVSDDTRLGGEVLFEVYEYVTDPPLS